MIAAAPNGGLEPGPPIQPQPSTLAQLEAIIENGLPHYEAVAQAMLEIHDRKLFKPASFKSYLKTRWGMSRSRGYQLLHFARLKKMSTAVDSAAGAQNERQARALAADGRAKPRQKPDLIGQAMQYLVVKFERLTPEEKREFIDYMRQLLDEMEALLEKQTSPAK